VHGQLARVLERPLAVHAFQRLGHLAVQRAEPRAGELAVERVLQQRVRQLVGNAVGGSRLHENPVGAQLVNRGEQRALVEPGERREHVVRHERSCHRRERGHPPRVGAEAA